MPRLAAILAVLLVTLSACGGDDSSSGDAAAPPATTAEPAEPATPASEVDGSTCAEIGGTKRYPSASLAETSRVAKIVSSDYVEKFGQAPSIVAAAFASAILAECDVADDPAHEPIPVLRKRADEAEEGELLVALLPERKPAQETEPESEPPSDAEVASMLDDACDEESALAGPISRAEKLSYEQATKLRLNSVILAGNMRGIAGDDAASIESFVVPLEDLGRNASLVALARRSGNDSAVEERSSDIEQDRVDGLAAAKELDDGKPLPACVKLFSG